MWQPGRKLEDVEKEVILSAYRFYNENKTRTASSLGIAIRTLDNKLAKYGVTKNECVRDNKDAAVAAS